MTPIEYCEKHYPEACEEFKKIQQADYELFCKKQLDYGPGNIKMGTDLSSEEDLRLSLTGLIIRMNDKIQRLIHLVIKTQREPENESITDAFDDLTVYGIIARIVSNGKWGK